MAVIFHEDKGPDADDQPAFFIDRLGHLAQVITEASDDRDLIMFRAYRQGASPEQIAEWAETSVDTVQRAIALLSGVRSVDEWCWGPKWLKWYPFE